MARSGTTYVYSATPGAGQGTALRNALNTNLAEWAVSAVFQFDAGTEERTYFVLSHTIQNDEILVYCPDGTTASITEGVYAPYIGGVAAGATLLSLLFGYAPEGGFLSALATQDPASSFFWDNIIVTQGLLQPGVMQPAPAWLSGATIQDLVFIEDDARAWLCVHNRRQSIPDTYHMQLMGRDIIENGYITAPSEDIGVHGHVVLKAATSGGPPDMDEFQVSYWNHNDVARVMTGYSAQSTFDAHNMLSALPVGAIPMVTDSSFPTTKIPLISSTFVSSNDATDNIIGFISADDMRYIPNNLSAFKSRLGNDTSIKFTYLNKGLLTPWDNLQADPA